MTKPSALFTEFEETGMNEKRGYAVPSRNAQHGCFSKHAITKTGLTEPIALASTLLKVWQRTAFNGNANSLARQIHQKSQLHEHHWQISTAFHQLRL